MGAFDHLRSGQDLVGFHGPVTSTIDWCELNYEHSYYIAELVNTLTNAPVVLLALYGWRATCAAGVPSRYAGVYLGLALIGIGSFGFHASLKWEWQLMDELPMIYVVSYAAYLVLDTLPSFVPRFGLFGPLVLGAWDIFVTFSYVSLPNPVYHQVAFALIMTFAIFRSVWLILCLPEQHPMKRTITRTLIAGVVTFVGGFGIWNLDNMFCTQLRDTRAALSKAGFGPIGFFIEGHAYWHLMTGYGAFLIFTACIQLCLSIKTSPDAWSYDEKSWFPIVKPVNAKDSKEIKGKKADDQKVETVIDDNKQ